MALLHLSLLISISFLFHGGVSQGQLRVGFYAETCPIAEAVVSSTVQAAFNLDRTIAPALLRLHFHDCFVQGCEGSILINTGAETDEREAVGHRGIRGFEIIENAKSRLEEELACPGIVSCSDIVALAARDAVVMARGLWYDVETGRRDGLSSNEEMANDMPNVDDPIEKLKEKFENKGLSDKDLVLLNAAHTIGTTSCFFMQKRLYSFFSNQSGSDPSINPEFLPVLKSSCPMGDTNDRVPIDFGNEPVTFDVGIWENIRSGFAVLRSDASLYEDEATKSVMDSYFNSFGSLSGQPFGADFAESMVKMGRIGVLTGSQGRIRSECGAF